MNRSKIAALALLLGALLLGVTGCRGTVRCPDGTLFDENGDCVSVDTCPSGRDPSSGECLASDGGTDAGSRDGGTRDGGTLDGGSLDGGDAGGVDAGRDASPPDGGDACGGACGACEVCNVGACEPATDGVSCGSGSGQCHAGGCCTGCWDGSSCQLGTTPTACGQLGADCVTCGCTSDVCSAGACEPLGGGVLDFDVTEHSCVVLVDGRLYCWGRNTEGQLGLGDTVARTSPVEVSPGTSWSDVDAGGFHTCAQSTTAGLFCWGDNAQGQLGVGDTTPRDRPAGVTSIGAVSSVGLGRLSGAIASGALYFWGDGTSSPSFVASSSPSPWSQVDATQEQSVGFAIRGDGTLWSYDFTGAGLEVVGSDTDWAIVDAGTYNVCAIKTSGELYCWGDGTNGILGFGSSMGFLSSPMRHGTLSDWVAVSLAPVGVCAVRSTGALHCSIPSSAFPVLSDTVIGSDSDWARVAVGVGVTCALKVDGSLWCFTGEITTASPTRVCFN